MMASLFLVVSYPQAFRHLSFPLYIPAAYHWLSYDLAKMADECIKTANLPANMKLFVFDLAGTTVDDSIEGVPLVAIAMKEAFHKNGYKIDVSLVNKYRGMEKRDAIQSILSELHELNGSNNSSSNISVDGLFEDFKFFLNQNLSSIKNEIAGTTEVFQKLPKPVAFSPQLRK